jgi:hypothetical protein
MLVGHENFAFAVALGPRARADAVDRFEREQRFRAINGVERSEVALQQLRQLLGRDLHAVKRRAGCQASGTLP